MKIGTAFFDQIQLLAKNTDAQHYLRKIHVDNEWQPGSPPRSIVIPPCVVCLKLKSSLIIRYPYVIR